MRPKYPCACGPGICGLVRRAHYLFAAGLFAILGFHVGIWAVQLASLSASLSLDPAALGAAITVAAAAGLVSGFGIGSYHFASLLGRLTATAALRRFGERRVMLAAGLLAAAGLLTAVTATAVAGAIGGLLLVGFAIAPVVPTTLSLAARSAPGRSGQAVATTTASGYGAFIVSPLTIGLLAQATSLRLALALLVVTSLAIAGLATRGPTASIPPG